MLGYDPSPGFPVAASDANAYEIAQGLWSARGPVAVRIELPGLPTAPGTARGVVHELLEPLVANDQVNEIALMASELVTNALRHGDAEEGIAMYVAVADGLVRAEVRDGGSGFDLATDPLHEEAVGGWGLRLIDALASRWGISGRYGTCVWFEIEAVA